MKLLSSDDFIYRFMKAHPRWTASIASAVFFCTLVFIIAAPSVLADTVNKTCITNDTLQVNSTFVIDVGGNITSLGISKTIPCPLGCWDDECSGTNIGNETTGVWLTYVAGVSFMCMGLFLGIPMAKMSGAKLDFGVNMKTATRYVFFFVGLFLVYLAFGMARGMGKAYGMEPGLLGAVDTSTMVMLITIMLFLFIFVIEFIFELLRYYAEKDVMKWGERVN